MDNDADDWCDVSPEAQLVLFPQLSANTTAVLHMIQGPNPCEKMAVVLELQARRHDEQLRLIHKLFEVQLVAVREATRKAAHNKAWAQFTEVGLGPEAQDPAVEKEEGELQWALLKM